jgi:sterol 24-C-methyltransferase
MPDLARLPAKAAALGRLITTSDQEYAAWMGTYEELFTDSPENTLGDFESGVPMRGYEQGSSDSLAQLYKVLHLMCTLGSVEKMYLPPTMDLAQSVKENQNIFEREMVKDLEVGVGDHVLDLGCGCGAIASHIAEVSGCTVHGINLDASQIKKAWENPNRAQLHFQVGNFNEPLPFGDRQFDGAYNVQALTYATDLAATFREVFRTLKPGSRFVVNDVAALDAYDRDNPHHKMLVQHTRELTVFGGFWHAKYWEAAFEAAGFEIISSEGRSAVEMIVKERATYDRFNVIGERLAKMHVIPQKVDTMLQRMNSNCASYIEAEELELLTLNWRFVVHKPA